MNHSFDRFFETLTGRSPFPWQSALYNRFTAARVDNIPHIADLPTGLGKTNVIAVWLLALLKRPDKMPRRLVYVVNRRTVVDQTTVEVQRLRRNIPKLGQQGLDDLAISTLRGQFADNQEWREDPSRPAVICGTVDMIGSRLLFEGYRIGFKSRPLHAGFLGQDTLLVHDEAHLEPAFQKLIETIQEEQKKEREQNVEVPWPGMRVMALSATARGNNKGGDLEYGQPFGLTDEEKQPPREIPDPPTEPIHHVWRRLQATKALCLNVIDGENKLVDRIAELALKHKGANVPVLVFVRRIGDVEKVWKKLTDKKNGVLSNHVRQLTGTMRGYERDQLVKSDPVFARFMPTGDRPKGLMFAEETVYLVCTSAGEVGVNLSADHMVCDLSTFDSMAQRLGRVNRFGDRDDTQVDVVHPESFGKVDKKSGELKAYEIDKRRANTLQLIRNLREVGKDDDGKPIYDASPKALGELPADQRLAAFAPIPTILLATNILFDAWAMTTIKGKVPGRPPVAPYLHGVAEWEPPRSSVAWRQEVELITYELIAREGKDFPQELLAEYPLMPHELLSDRTDRVLSSLQKLAADHPNAAVWIVNDQQQVRVSILSEIANPAATKAAEKAPLEKAIVDSVILLPPSVGGLSGGMLDPSSDGAGDVADLWLDENNGPRRERQFNDTAHPEDGPQNMALIGAIDLNPLAEELAAPNDESEVDIEAESESEPDNENMPKRGRFWHWYIQPRNAEEATRASIRPIRLDHHSSDAAKRAREIMAGLNLTDDLERAVILAAELHDIGKQREIWQRSIGNPDPTDWHAKPGKPKGRPRWRARHLSGYRHEFGSVLDVLHTSRDREGAGPHLVEKLSEFHQMSPKMQDVVLHLIAAHHGRARPHIPSEAYDHERYNTQQNEDAALEVMRRYSRLQRCYGRWGLAYLESLVRAADWAASANPSEPSSSSDGDT